MDREWAGPWIVHPGRHGNRDLMFSHLMLLANSIKSRDGRCDILIQMPDPEYLPIH
jgi:hypothetical protein